MTRLRVAVLDDHPSVRAGVRAVVTATDDLEHVGEAGSEAELWPLLRDARPRVLLVDLHHPGRNGLALAAALTDLADAPRVVLHTAARSDEIAVATPIAGVVATASKRDSGTVLLEAIRAAARPGARHEPPNLLARRRVLTPLEPADRAIAAMLLSDTPVVGIAEALRVAPKEVRRRIEVVLQQILGAPAAAQQAPALARDAGWPSHAQIHRSIVGAAGQLT